MPGEFLVLEVGDVRGAGSTLVIRSVTDSEAGAKEELGKLAVAAGVRLAVVETKGVFILEPVVNVKAVADAILVARP